MSRRPKRFVYNFRDIDKLQLAGVGSIHPYATSNKTNSGVSPPLAIFGSALKFWGRADAGLSTDGAVNLVAASSQSLSGTLSNAPTATGGTLAVWITPNGTQSAGWAISLGNGITGGVSINFSGASLNVQGGISGISNTTTFTTTNGTPCLLVLTWTSTGISFYANGSLIGTATGSVTIPNAILNIGSFQGSAAFYNGSNSQTEVWATPLSPTLISLLYASGSGLPFEAWPSSLLTGLVSVYPFYQPGNLGQDRFGSNTLTNNGGTYVAGHVVGVPQITGDAVSGGLEYSGNNNTWSQATGANRWILQNNAFGTLPAVQSPGTNGLYALLSTITLPGPWSLYGAINRPTSTETQLIGGSLLSVPGYLYTDNNVYASDNSNQIAHAYSGSNGKILFRCRRDASNNVWIATSGMSEVQLTGTLTATCSPIHFLQNSTAGNQVEEAFLANVDSVTSGQDSAALAWLKSRTGLSLP